MALCPSTEPSHDMFGRWCHYSQNMRPGLPGWTRTFWLRVLAARLFVAWPDKGALFPRRRRRIAIEKEAGGYLLKVLVRVNMSPPKGLPIFLFLSALATHVAIQQRPDPDEDVRYPEWPAAPT